MVIKRVTEKRCNLKISKLSTASLDYPEIIFDVTLNVLKDTLKAFGDFKIK